MKSAGFTLVELLVALFIFGLLAAGGTALLASGIEASNSARAAMDRQGALARSRSLLMADLAQAADRPWRAEDGSRQPAFQLGADRLVLVRRGWRNEGGAARASLQRVEWRIVEGRLERRAAAMLDGASWGPPAAALEGLRGGQFAALGPEGREMPAAVALTLDLPGGPVRQLFRVGVPA
jgi:general secretion pathway protein J